jgi:hypothetical protein
MPFSVASSTRKSVADMVLNTVGSSFMVGVGMDEDSFVLLFLFSKRKNKAVCDEISRFWVDGMKASGRQLIVLFERVD